MDIGVAVEDASANPERALAEAIDRVGAALVNDLSDEPVLSYRKRTRLISIALWKGADYRGSDFYFKSPDRSVGAGAASLAVMGTGKRCGKTAIAGAAARILRDAGRGPVIVSMGRGGPPAPEVIAPGQSLDPQTLLKWTDEGRHASSDYVEDALTSGVATVGAWRAGGGLAGAVAYSNFAEALGEAEKLRPGILLLEGSGASIPPARWDAALLAVDARADPEHLCGYFGLYRLLLADLVVLTMAEASLDPHQVQAVESCIRDRPNGSPEVIRTIFRPHPLGDIKGKRIWFATTAPPQAAGLLTAHLQDRFGAKVTGMSHALADRRALRNDLEEAENADAVLVELKAAAVDVVTRYAVDRGIEVVYADNRVEILKGEKPFEEAILSVAALAQERFTQ
jgi:cyclic 2,3-diphosphoglycerate synthase